VILDTQTFCEDFHKEKNSIKVCDELESVYCPPYVHGYSLNQKMWCRFFVDCISDIDWNPSAWDGLILGHEQKLVLKALVSSHKFPENARDVTRQKGKGLVVLLHGSPGSGKTMTAGKLLPA
jgi:hypothetical protein